MVTEFINALGAVCCLYSFNNINISVNNNLTCCINSKPPIINNRLHSKFQTIEWYRQQATSANLVQKVFPQLLNNFLYRPHQVRQLFDPRGAKKQTSAHIIQQVDLGDGVAGVPGVLHQQGDEPDERVQGVETLGADQRGAVVGLGQRAVAQIHAHLRTQAEEARDEVVRLQDALLVHLKCRVQVGDGKGIL